MKRYSYSTVGYGVFSLFGERYCMGRIEVYDRENESGYAVHEGAYSVPFEVASKFEEFMDSLETDLPINIEIGSHEWCADECAKSLGFENEAEMRDPDKVKEYRRKQNDIFAVKQGYKDWDDLMANSKWNKKCEYSGLPSVESYDTGSVDEVEDKTFKQKSKWTKVKRNSSSKYE